MKQEMCTVSWGDGPLMARRVGSGPSLGLWVGEGVNRSTALVHIVLSMSLSTNFDIICLVSL